MNPAHQYFDSVLQQNARNLGRRMPTPTTATSHLPSQPPTGAQTTTGTAPMIDHHHHHHSAVPPTAPQMYRGQPTPNQFTGQGFQHMAHRLSREAAIHRAYLNQWDRANAAPGLRGPQPTATSPLEAAQRRPSPAPSHDSYPTSESLQQRFRGGDANLSDAEVQNILRGADARQAILTMTNAMQRSASGTSLGPPSGRVTPNSSFRATSGSGGGAGLTVGQVPSFVPSHPSPDVYILYSPTGPRALLINSHTSETYYTPQTRTASANPHLGLPNLPTFRPASAQSAPTPDQPTPGTEQSEREFEEQQEEAAQRLRRRVRVHINHPAAQPGHGRPHHPGAVAVIARIWPHFWLAVRLGLFVWWFTSPASSWWRWSAVIAIAVTIFVLNTGALDGLAETTWRVICRHMEDLIPVAGQDRPGAQADQERNRDQAGPQAPREEHPQPGTLATRLVRNRRRGNATWLLDRVRRMERASLLFLASIAPGVAERHIANLEAEVERQRRETEAAAEEARHAAERENADANAEAGAQNTGAAGAENTEATGDARPERSASPAPQALQGEALAL